MLAKYFGVLDWIVIALYLVGNTLIGHFLQKKQKSTADFFLGGRALPWYAVSASIIATAISAITFIGVPALVYAKEGNLLFLQFAIGSVVAKFIVAKYFIPLYYQKDFYSPYDYMADKFGSVVGQVTALLFFVGAILGQGVRVYATALVLEVITGISLVNSIWLIAGFSVLWTWMGGIAAVIWTDFVQFFIFVFGALVAIIYAYNSIPMEGTEMFTYAQSLGKLNIVDFSMNFHTPFIFWAAVIAMPFQNVAAYGVDQNNTQRLLCCKSVKESQKATYWSNIGELVTVMMVFMGIMLFLYYEHFPIPEDFIALIKEKTDRIFPVYIITSLPAGIKGLMIAAIFATANSSLDSTLAALSQTTMTMFYKPKFAPDANEETLVKVSRIFVLIWGVLLALMAIACATTQSNLVNLAFSMTGYTYGPMLGIFLFAMIKKKKYSVPLMWIVPVSLIFILFIQKPALFGLEVSTGSLLAWPWVFPIGTIFVYTMLQIFSKEIKE